MITEIPPAAATTAGPAGAAGSDEDRVILRDGSAIVVRPLATGDVAAIASWFEGLRTGVGGFPDGQGGGRWPG